MEHVGVQDAAPVDVFAEAAAADDTLPADTTAVPTENAAVPDVAAAETAAAAAAAQMEEPLVPDTSVEPFPVSVCCSEERGYSSEAISGKCVLL